MGLKTVFREEVQNELKELRKMELGSEEYRSTVDGVTKLADRIIEMDKLDNERQVKAETQDREFELKQEQMKEEKKDRIIKNCLTGVSVVGGILVTIWGTIVSINFEKEGTFTTSAGRKHVNKLLSLFK